MSNIFAYVGISECQHKYIKPNTVNVNTLGYGRKIATQHMVKLPPRFVGFRNVWRRVYVCCFSNAGTAYIDTDCGWIVVTNH